MRKNFKNIDIFANAVCAAADKNNECVTFDTAEHIKIKQVYTAEDTKDMQHPDYAAGLPPFLLGLNWSTTERMSTQQADILTSELWSLRRTVEPAVRKICRMYLATEGLDDRFEIQWEDISLQDITEEAQAELAKAQAEKYRAEAVR